MQNGIVLYEREHGFADLSNEVSNTIETRFASASAGKVFVAVGILQLIYNPNNGIISVLVSNYGDNVWKEMKKIRDALY